MLYISQIGQVFLSIGILVACIALFIGTYLLNKHTKAPDGCSDMSEGCEGCSILSCSHHKKMEQNDETNKEEEKTND